MGVFFKTVLLPIRVPVGDYCWGYNRICEHFDNVDAVPTCNLNLGELDYNEELFVLKPKKCLSLELKR